MFVLPSHTFYRVNCFSTSFDIAIETVLFNIYVEPNFAFFDRIQEPMTLKRRIRSKETKFGHPKWQRVQKGTNHVWSAQIIIIRELHTWLTPFCTRCHFGLIFDQFTLFSNFLRENCKIKEGGSGVKKLTTSFDVKWCHNRQNRHLFLFYHGVVGKFAFTLYAQALSMCFILQVHVFHLVQVTPVADLSSRCLCSFILVFKNVLKHTISRIWHHLQTSLSIEDKSYWMRIPDRLGNLSQPVR